MLIWVSIEMLNIIALWLFGFGKDCGKMLVKCAYCIRKYLPRKGAWGRGATKARK
jgi:hypothetical protein